MRLICMLWTLKKRCHEYATWDANIMWQVMPVTFIFDIIHFLALFDSRYEVTLKHIFLLKYFFCYSGLIFISLFNSPIDFIFFHHFCENFLMLHYGSIIRLKHNLRRFDTLHLLEIIYEDWIIFGSLKPNLGSEMIDLLIFLAHNPSCNLLSR